MKNLITLLMLFGVVAVQATEPVIRSLEGGKYQLETGPVTMTVDGAMGGRILSFRHGDREVVSQSTFPESFGSTFWTSPQSEWNWPPVPEYDKMPYTVERSDRVLVMTSHLSPKHYYRIRKEFRPEARGIAITYIITNESAETRRVAPWEITRVPNEGLIFFDTPTESISPTDLIAFTAKHDLAWYRTDVRDDNRKVNADGHGWLAYLTAENLLFVKQFPDLNAGQAAPNEAEIQVYVNRGKTFIEIENQGAYTKLAPGESLSYTVIWNLQPAQDNPKQLAATIKNIIN